jgi:hypothetical protein
MFSMDSSERVQAADLVICTTMDRPELAGKSWSPPVTPRLIPQL